MILFIFTNFFPQSNNVNICYLLAKKMLNQISHHLFSPLLNLRFSSFKLLFLDYPQLFIDTIYREVLINPL